jgi:hypothetical protein
MGNAYRRKEKYRKDDIKSDLNHIHFSSVLWSSNNILIAGV